MINVVIKTHIQKIPRTFVVVVVGEIPHRLFAATAFATLFDCELLVAGAPLVFAVLLLLPVVLVTIVFIGLLFTLL